MIVLIYVHGQRNWRGGIGEEIMGKNVTVENKTYRMLPSGKIQRAIRIVGVPAWETVPATATKTLEKVRAAFAA